MLKTLRLQNIKAHGDTSFEFSKFTLLVGPNGSGKSTVLQALSHMSQSTREYPFPHRNSPRSGIKVSMEIEGSTIVAHSKGLGAPGYWQNDARTLPETQTLRLKMTRFEPAIALNLEPTVLATATSTTDGTPVRFEGRGEGLAGTLAQLKLADDGIFDAIEDDLRRIIPSARKIRIQRPA